MNITGIVKSWYKELFWMGLGAAAVGLGYLALKKCGDIRRSYRVRKAMDDYEMHVGRHDVSVEGGHEADSVDEPGEDGVSAADCLTVEDEEGNRLIIHKMEQKHKIPATGPETYLDFTMLSPEIQTARIEAIKNGEINLEIQHISTVQYYNEYEEHPDICCELMYDRSENKFEYEDGTTAPGIDIDLEIREDLGWDMVQVILNKMSMVKWKKETCTFVKDGTWYMVRRV